MRPQIVTAVTACAFALIAFTGCSDEPDPTWGEELVGIYTVDSLTENTQSCEADGTSSVTDDRDHMVVFAGSDFGGRYVRADGCADIEACRQHVRNIQENKQGVAITFSFVFRADKGDRLEGVWVTTGYSGGPDPNVCTEAELTNITLMTPTDTTVRIEARSAVVDHPPDADGTCWTSDTEKAAAGKPCSILRTASATRAQSL